MRYVIIFLPILLIACGGDDVLNPVLQPGDDVVVVLPDGESIPVVVADEQEPELECPEEYALADLVIETCWHGTGMVAEGEGCLKTLREMTDGEFEEWCEEIQ